MGSCSRTLRTRRSNCTANWRKRPPNQLEVRGLLSWWRMATIMWVRIMESPPLIHAWLMTYSDAPLHIRLRQYRRPPLLWLSCEWASIHTREQWSCDTCFVWKIPRKGGRNTERGFRAFGKKASFVPRWEEAARQRARPSPASTLTIEQGRYDAIYVRNDESARETNILAPQRSADTPHRKAYFCPRASSQPKLNPYTKPGTTLHRIISSISCLSTTSTVPSMPFWHPSSPGQLLNLCSHSILTQSGND